MPQIASKASMLQYIYNAKRAHKNWIRKADQLVNGLEGPSGIRSTLLEVDKSYIPLDSRECEFGTWLDAQYSTLYAFKSIGKFMHRIEEHHNQLHDTYRHIYTIFFIAPKSRSFLQKLLTFNAKSVTKAEIEQAQVHFTYLKRSSSELMEVLDILEEKIRNLELSEFIEIN